MDTTIIEEINDDFLTEVLVVLLELFVSSWLEPIIAFISEGP